MQEKEKAVKQLYEVSKKTAGAPPPKRGLFGTKCPKCGCKLEKHGDKVLIVPGDAGTELANLAAKDLGLDPGAYTLSVEHFKCSCGYEFARAAADVLGD